MADKFWLTDKDRQVIRDIVRKEAYRLKLPRRDTVTDDFFGPEIYVAKVPEAGIPGMTVAQGTGSPSSAGDPVVSCVECDVYKYVDGNLLQGGFKYNVCNCNAAAVAGNTWLVIARDKFGTWW